MSGQQFSRINGRFKTRSGQMVAVHDSTGHPIDDVGEAITDISINYSSSGNCVGLYTQGVRVEKAKLTDHDLMESVQHSATAMKTVVRGCPICEKENP